MQIPGYLNMYSQVLRYSMAQIQKRLDGMALKRKVQSPVRRFRCWWPAGYVRVDMRYRSQVHSSALDFLLFALLS